MYTKTKLSREDWVDFIDANKDPTAVWQEDWVEAARNRVHNLNLSNSYHRDLYNSILQRHIMFNEITWDDEDVDIGRNSRGKLASIPKIPDVSRSVYLDHNGFKTIGIGFNMDRPEACFEWDEVLKDKVSFDDARDGKKNITAEQAHKLFVYSIEIREKELQNKFKEEWDLLKPNEKITITSMYYNKPALIGKNLSKYIKDYIKTDDPAYLKLAVNEVRYGSNKHMVKGVQIRMDREAVMLKSYECPLYSQPSEEAIPEGDFIYAEIGKTVIPLIDNIDEDDIDNENNKKEYYIWRTQNDSKVRPKHQLYDGLIFHIDNPPSIGHPGDDYNCRCMKDYYIPDFVKINKEKPKEANKEAYQEELIIERKYIANLFDIPGFCIKNYKSKGPHFIQ